MKLGIIGLGRMGRHMALRLIKKKHKVVAYNRTKKKVKEIEKRGAIGAYSYKEVCDKLESPRIIWIMVPAGNPVDKVITELVPYLQKDDIVIDGGNSNYNDSVRRAEYLRAEGVYYLDIGTSGGLGGEKHGYCFMVGGEKKAYNKIKPILKALSAENGFDYMGPSGAGHYVKMVHNGIEYAMLQSYGEGYELLHESPYDINLADVAELWSNGSVIRSWLTELAAEAFKKDPKLKNLKDFVGGGSTGEWTVKESMDIETPSPMISLALALRYRSRQKESFASKVVAILRNKFGGHKVKKK